MFLNDGTASLPTHQHMLVPRSPRTLIAARLTPLTYKDGDCDLYNQVLFDPDQLRSSAFNIPISSLSVPVTQLFRDCVTRL